MGELRTFPRPEPAGRFVHLDVISAFSPSASPSTPEAYVRTLARQYPIDDRTAAQHHTPAIPLADTNLASAVKMAIACAREGVEHLPGLRVRVVAERAYRGWGERPGELVLLAMDESGWLNLVALNNIAHLSGADSRGPRLDWRDLAEHSEGLLCLTGPPGRGLLSPLIARAADPAEPLEALGLARRLMALFPDRLYLELAYHGRPTEKLVNHGLVVLAERLDLPLVATNAVRIARPEDALALTILEAMAQGRAADGLLGSGRRESDVPQVALEATRAQAYLKSPQEMARLFSRLPAALEATVEIARRCTFRLLLAATTSPEHRYGPGLLFGLEPARGLAEDELLAMVEEALPARFAATGRGEVPDEVRARAHQEVRALCASAVAELLLIASEVARYCAAHGIGLAARGSATCSLVAWALGLVELCPLDHDLQGEVFAHEGRSDLPDVDLEVSSLHEPAVSAFVLQSCGHAPARAERPAGSLPAIGALRLGIHVSLGARQAVRSVGAALGLEPPRVNALARLVPLLSSPGAIEQVLTHAPELGVPDLSPNAEPYHTILQVAAQLESLPHRPGAHPTAYTFSFCGPGALAWLPALWVGSDRPGRRRFGSARHLAVLAQERAQTAELAHVAAAPANEQAPAVLEPEGELDASEPLAPAELGTGGSTLACQWDKEDLEALGLCRLDISPSAALAAVGSSLQPEVDAATAAAAWRLLEAGDTLCLSQVETLGMRLLLRRARDAYGEGPHAGSALQKLEDLAQLLALWRPGAYGPEREQAYFAVRFGGERPTYPHPAMARVLDTTAGQLLYADQLLGLIKLLGFDHAWADRYRRALAGGRRAGRDELERELRERARQQGWTPDQVSALVALLVEHVGYLYHHGHALAMAQHAFRQACLKVNPATAATFFAEVMNNGGSSYGLGAAVEEARRFGVVLLPPCVNRSGLHFLVEHDSPEVEALGDKARTIAGAVRVPLTAIRGLGPQAAEHIVAVRGVFGSYTSLVDFSRRVDPSLVGRHDLLLLIKLGAFSFTGLSRAQLTLAERYYAGSADLLRAVDRDPSGLATVEEDLAQSAAKFLDVAEWPPEVLAAQELAHLGFYVQAPLEVQRHAPRLAEEFGVVSIAELGDYPDRARVSVGAVITNLRIRTTKKGQRMAWLSLADGTGAIECAVFPKAYEQLGQSTVLREGAFLVARGNLAHEEATGSKLFISEVVPLGGRGTRLSALAVAVEQRRVRSAGT